MKLTDEQKALLSAGVLTGVLCIGEPPWQETCLPCDGRHASSDYAPHTAYFVVGLNVWHAPNPYVVICEECGRVKLRNCLSEDFWPDLKERVG